MSLNRTFVFFLHKSNLLVAVLAWLSNNIKPYPFIKNFYEKVVWNVVALPKA